MFQTNLFSDVASVEQYIGQYPIADALYQGFKPEWKTLVQDYFLSQKLAVAFPAERMSCYSADLLLRQYEQVKNQMKKKFSYSAMNKVYTIVIFENTNEESTSAPVYRAFHASNVKNRYLHHGTTTFDTGLNLEFLQEFYLISLDVFREVGYAKEDNELTAWLSLLATNTYEEAELLCQKYPWMEEIFEEISEYVHNPEEVLGMFSQALKMMDDNMYQFMSDQHIELVKKQKTEIQNQQAEIQKLYQVTVQLVKKHEGSKEDATDELIKNCNLSPESAEDLVEKYW